MQHSLPRQQKNTGVSTHRILWDFDGTLVDTYPSYAKALSDVTHGAVTYEAAYAALKVSFRHAAKIFSLSEGQLSELDDLTDRINPLLARPFPGLEAVLRSAELNVIMTHKDRRGAKALLREHGLLHYFADMVCADDGFPRKPDPASYRYLHNKYGLTLAVGDRELDVIPAKAIELSTCLFQNEQGAADYHVSDYREFWSVVPMRGK